MSHTLVNPPALHDPVPFGYSHVASVSGPLVVVAGQYASDADGHVVSDDFGTQVDRSLANLGTALDAVDLDFRHVVQLRTYVVDLDADKLGILVERLERIWGGNPPTQTLLGVAGLALPGMAFEVDALAAGT
ncbi:Rid family hydrolase [Actinopolymorpha sp. B17G11]|uniref:RidA family protein n=1 Tax=unclassified Actinopolymorpha TaxID=2627063 RepID=UPI0032D8D450